MKSIYAYQIRIELKEILPLLWRRILISPNTPLSSLHFIIQTVVGWRNFHQYRFIKGREIYTLQPRKTCRTSLGSNDNDLNRIRVRDLLKDINEDLLYEYDFEEHWKHQLILENIFREDTGYEIPHCLEGEINCPPEDCGGPWGYMEMVKILKKPWHEKHLEYRECFLGYDPLYFEINKVNTLLRNRSY